MAVGTTVKLAFDGKDVQRGIANVTKSIAGIGKNAAASLIRPFAQLTAMLAPTAIVGGMVAFGKASSEAAANIENMRAQFYLFTGSGSGTEKLIKDLRKIAVESPLELTDIADGARMLLTYGLAAEDVSGIVNQLSDVSAGSAERFQRISYAFGQISSMGRLTGTELRQLTEVGFNPLEFIAKKTGESMADLKARMEDGRIPITEVKEALKAATSEGGRFYGMNQKMAQTFTGRVSMMKDQWSQLLQGFGTGMNDGLKVAVDAITASLPQFLEKFRTIGNYFGDAIAEAVAGDYQKFVAIGDLIGTAIKVGMLTAAEATGQTLVQKWADWAKRLNENIPLPANQVVAGVAAKVQRSNQPSFSELIEANAINAGLQSKAQTIMGTTPQPFRPSYESPSQQAERDRQFLQRIDKLIENTRGGSKM